jgi:hypothetical protein
VLPTSTSGHVAGGNLALLHFNLFSTFVFHISHLVAYPVWLVYTLSGVRLGIKVKFEIYEIYKRNPLVYI